MRAITRFSAAVLTLITLSGSVTALAATDPAVAPTTTVQPTVTTQPPTPESMQSTAAVNGMTAQNSNNIAVTTTDYSGQVLKVSKDSLVIDSSTGSKEFMVLSNVKIQRNGSAVELKEIKPGDKVVVKATNKGEVLAVAATAGSVVNKTKSLLGLLIALLVLAAIVWYVLKKRNRGFIKTVPTKL